MGRSEHLALQPLAGRDQFPVTDPLFDGNLRAVLGGFRQALDTFIDHFADRLEEFDPRIGQVLPYRERNPEGVA